MKTVHLPIEIELNGSFSVEKANYYNHNKIVDWSIKTARIVYEKLKQLQELKDSENGFVNTLIVGKAEEIYYQYYKDMTAILDDIELTRLHLIVSINTREIADSSLDFEKSLELYKSRYRDQLDKPYESDLKNQRYIFKKSVCEILKNQAIVHESSAEFQQINKIWRRKKKYWYKKEVLGNLYKNLLRIGYDVVKNQFEGIDLCTNDPVLIKMSTSELQRLSVQTSKANGLFEERLSDAIEHQMFLLDRLIAHKNKVNIIMLHLRNKQERFSIEDSYLKELLENVRLFTVTVGEMLSSSIKLYRIQSLNGYAEVIQDEFQFLMAFQNEYLLKKFTFNQELLDSIQKSMDIILNYFGYFGSTIEFRLNYFDNFTERVIERRVLELKAL